MPTKKQQQAKMRAAKQRSAFLGILVILAIIITGTFAFTYARQAAINPGRVAQSDLEGGRVHDDFEDRDGPGNLDKDVFAENFGVTDLGVRIRFREFAEVNGVAIGGTSVGPAVINNPQTWPIYLASPNDVHTRRAGTYSAAIGAVGIDWTLGNADGVEKIFMPTFNHVSRPGFPLDTAASPPILPPFDNPEMYRFSNTTGRAVEAIAGFNVGTVTSVNDFINSGLQTGPAISDGTHDFWSVGQMYTSTLYFIDYNMSTPSISTATVTHIAQRALTPEEGGVMTIAEWIAADFPSGNFWIKDVDGWFYWNGYLPGVETRRAEARAMREYLGLAPAAALPAEYAWMDLPTIATSLLLNGIHAPNVNGLEYIIHIESDFFSHYEYLGTTITEEARMIFLPELFFIHDTTYTRTAAGIAGVPTGSEGAVNIATITTVLRRQRGNEILGFVYGLLEAEVLGEGSTLAEVYFAIPAFDEAGEILGNDGHVMLLVSESESRETLTIRISEPRARNHIDIILNVLP